SILGHNAVDLSEKRPDLPASGRILPGLTALCWERKAVCLPLELAGDAALELGVGGVGEHDEAVELLAHPAIGGLALGRSRRLVDRDGQHLLRPREAAALGLRESRVAHASGLLLGDVEGDLE